MRAPRGRRGDGHALRPRPGGRERALPRFARAPEDRPLLADATRRGIVLADVRGRRDGLAPARRGGRAPELRPRRRDPGGSPVVIVLLVRHARAGKRSKWEGDDRLRPLDKRGRKQAEGLVSLLAEYPIDRIASSPYLRCTQTVDPLAASRGLAVEERDELAEGSKQVLEAENGRLTPREYLAPPV